MYMSDTAVSGRNGPGGIGSGAGPSVIAAGLSIIFAIILLSVLAPFDFDQSARENAEFDTGTTDGNVTVSEHYTANGVNETGSANLVTSVVVDYRGFDTLGEVTVLFMAATGLTLVYGLEKTSKRDEEGEGNGEEDDGEVESDPDPAIRPTEASLVVKAGSKMLFPLIMLFAAYILVHGHLTPGGGFQGGVIIASGIGLLMMVFGSEQVRSRTLHTVESLSGAMFVVIGIIGLLLYDGFLHNFADLGTPGDLLSAGLIPVIYIFVGFKVGSELTSVIGKALGIPALGTGSSSDTREENEPETHSPAVTPGGDAE